MSGLSFYASAGSVVPPEIRLDEVEYIQFNAEVALIPPIFVFVVASAFGWAFRGFR
jgi:hypothetical protein